MLEILLHRVTFPKRLLEILQNKLRVAHKIPLAYNFCGANPFALCSPTEDEILLAILQQDRPNS